MLREPVRDHIRALTDGELIAYLIAGTPTYEAEAVAFARAEFDRRRLDPKQLDEQADIPVAEYTLPAREGTAPPLRIGYRGPPDEPETPGLDWDGRALAFVAGCLGLGSLLFVFPIWLRYDLAGERDKRAELKRSYLWGLLVNLMAIAGYIVFSLS